jgi:hypothetical protein
MLNTVVELPEYTNKVNKLLEADEQTHIISYVAEYPESGNVIPGTGGVRKLRWRYRGKGKRGGVRIIYYYYNENFPVFMLNLFPKSEKEDLTAAERNHLAKLVEMLKKDLLKKQS